MTPVLYYRSVNLIRAPYPTRYGLLNASTVKSPFMHIMNRLFVVQFKAVDGIKTLLFSPSDFSEPMPDALFQATGDPLWCALALGRLLSGSVRKYSGAGAYRLRHPSEDVDYLSYDHLHTQDIRRWLGMVRHLVF